MPTSLSAPVLSCAVVNNPIEFFLLILFSPLMVNLQRYPLMLNYCVLKSVGKVSLPLIFYIL